MALARGIANSAEPAQKRAPDALSALLGLGRPLVMGILNVTPDSFSDGGQFIDPATAIAHAGTMAKQGADILDIGAESTRPYGRAVPVSADDELARLAPVLPAVVRLGLPDRFLESGAPSELRAEFGLTAEGIAARVATLCRCPPLPGREERRHDHVDQS